MNKIFNWTLGSVFRTIGRVIGYLLIAGLFAIIMSKSGLKITDLIGIDTIYASTISYDYSKYYVRTTDYPFSNTDNTWSSALNLGDYYNTTDIGYVNSIRTRFGVNAKFSANTKYRVKINVKFNNDTDKSIYLDANSVICQGSSTSTWTSDENLIDTCKFVARTYYNDNKNASYLFDIIPNTNIYGIQIAFYIKGSQYPYWSGDRIQALRVLPSSNITTDTSTSDTINNSTTEIIYNNNQNTEQIINNQNEMLGNKCTNIYQSRLPVTTECGITVTPNDDGSYTINGTSTCSIDFRLDQTTRNGTSNLFNLPKGTYTLSSDNLPNGLSLIVMQQNTWVSYFSNNSSTPTNTNTLNSKINNLFLYVYVDNNTTINNYTIKPMLTQGTNLKSYCEYGSTQSKLDDTNNAINNLNDTMNNSDSSGAQSDAGNFFSGFSTNTHGLTSIITAPLNAIQSLTSKSCSPLVLPLPFVNQSLTLPCMRAIYIDTFGGFMNIYDIIVIGIISYWIMVRIFAMVKDFKNPEHDEVEVVDL